MQSFGGSGRLGAISPGLMIQTGVNGNTGAPVSWLSHATQVRRHNLYFQENESHYLYPFQLVLEVIIDVIDSPLVANFTFMLKNVLPGGDFMYTILELMSSENVSVKVGAINLLSLFLSAPDGQVNNNPL